MTLPEQSEQQITRILRTAGANGHSPSDELLPIVYDQLRAIAAQALAKLPSGQTLQATALVHEAWLRIRREDDEPEWVGREHYFCAAAKAVREILIEQARSKSTIKRAGLRARDVDVVDLAISSEIENTGILALDAAIRRLEEQRPRHSRVVSLRFFAGLSMEDIAATLRVPLRSIERDWAFARAWLRDEVKRGLENA